MLGAGADTLPLIKRYMLIWYPGVIFVIVPMTGNFAIRATGDTKTPAVIMLIAAGVNTIMDPLLIFGIGPFPRLEIAGAAIATVCGRATALVVSLWVLGHRERMLRFVLRPARAVADSWKRILYVGLPASGALMIVPVTFGVITRIVSAYGGAAVAAFGASTRIEFFALAVIMALSSAIAPFIGQNWGAMRYERVKTGIRLGRNFSLVWGAGMFLVLAAAAGPIASIINDDPAVIETIVRYFRIAPLGYGMWGAIIVSVAALNVLNKPLHAAGLRMIQMFALHIPLALLGSHLFGLTGIFFSVAATNLIAGTVAHFVLNRQLRF
jgi:Na+-driven multidrug efflux pump